MNVLEVCRDALMSFFYGSSIAYTDIPFHEQQVVYIVSMAICLTLIIAFVKMLFRAFKI